MSAAYKNGLKTLKTYYIFCLKAYEYSIDWHAYSLNWHTYSFSCFFGFFCYRFVAGFNKMVEDYPTDILTVVFKFLPFQYLLYNLFQKNLHIPAGFFNLSKLYYFYWAF